MTTDEQLDMLCQQNSMFGLVRRKIPNRTPFELQTMFPEPPKTKPEPFVEMRICGGLMHHLLQGWRQHGYKLVIYRGHSSGSLDYCREEIVEVCNWLDWDHATGTASLPKMFRERWERMIKEFHGDITIS